MQFEGAPPQDIKLYFSMRLAQLNAMRFVCVRNLAYLHYKKPDGSGLMSYQATLFKEREDVIRTVMQHELFTGLILPDYMAPAHEPDPAKAAHAETISIIRQAIREAFTDLNAMRGDSSPPKSLTKPEKGKKPSKTRMRSPRVYGAAPFPRLHPFTDTKKRGP